MKQHIDHIWNTVSRIGLREGEGIMQFRDVILLNRLMLLMVIVMIFYLPIEIGLNGFALVPYVIGMIALFLVSLIFHHYRKFILARYYLYIIAMLFIGAMGVMVGKGINNFVMFIPVILLSTILFKTRLERMLILSVTVGVFVLQQWLFDVVPSQMGVPPELRATFANVFFILALILTYLIGTYFLGINREYEDIIVIQKERLQLKNKEVTDSITYAKRIQNAILPSQKTMKEHLGDSFVLYKPKDIVAGDFYWMEPVDDLVIFAAADCTGHGVPGAMVSVVCNNALNRSVRELGLTDPGKILDSTTEMIVSEFEKSDEEVKDGMDISLCAFNKTTKELRWSGANNPLWLVRNGEINEYKADKQPIGKHANRKPFTTHVIQLHEGDTFYLFSDGYHDQFGGEKGKKFKAAKMKELVLSIQSKLMEHQKSIIDETFESWKGELEQIDDVCVIGVRV